MARGAFERTFYGADSLPPPVNIGRDTDLASSWLPDYCFHAFKLLLPVRNLYFCAMDCTLYDACDMICMYV